MRNPHTSRTPGRAFLLVLLTLTIGGDGYAELPSASSPQLGVQVNRFYPVTEFGSAKPVQEGARFMVLDLQLVNRISADMVFEQGIAESLNLQLGAFQLAWDATAIAAGRPALLAQPGHLPDPVQLRFAAAKAEGKLVFEVPAEDPESLALLFKGGKAGVFKIPLIGEAPEIIKPPATGGGGRFVPPARPAKPKLPSRHERLVAETREHLDALGKMPAPAGAAATAQEVRELRPGASIAEKTDRKVPRAHYTLQVSGEDSASLWEIAVVHPSKKISFELKSGDGVLLVRSAREQQVAVGDLRLEPGTYQLEIKLPRSDEHFSLGTRKTGPLRKGFEFEPNGRHDERSLPMFIALEDEHMEVSGRLVGREVDCYILNVPEGEYLATIEMHSDKPATLEHLVNGKALVSESGSGASVDYLHLLAGHHVFSVRGEDAEYKLRALLTPVPDEFFEEEPNYDLGHSKLLTFSRPYRGIISKARDEDWFRFRLAARREIRIAATPPPGAGLRLQVQRRGITMFEASVAAGETLNGRVELGPGSYGVVLTASTAQEEAYSFVITPAPLAPDAEESDRLALSWKGRLAASAYHGTPQQISGEVRFNGPGQPEIEALSSNDHVFVEVGESRENSTPLKLRVLADTPTDRAVDVVILARMPGAPLLKSTVTLDIMPTHPPTGESWEDTPLPTPLLGKFNVLAMEFGATPIIPENLPERDAKEYGDLATALTDGINNRGNAARIRTRNPVEPTFRLPGNKPWPVAGTILKLDSNSALADGLREFRIEGSNDGKTFSAIFTGQLKPVYQPQAFVFPAPLPVRFARLVALSAQGGEKRVNILIAEWKLLSGEGNPLPGADIGQESLGGHVVWQKNDPSERSERVIGFHNNRCALIESIAWHNDPGHLPGGSRVNPQSVRIEVSTETPFGPWKKVGEFPIDPNALKIELGLPEQVWARFVKLGTAPPPEGKNYVGEYPLPGTIETGRESILAEWGDYRRDSAYERMPGNKPKPAGAGQTGGATREKAEILEIGKQVAGSVWIDAGHEAWFRVSAPVDGTNHLQCRLAGDRMVKASLEVYDAAGRAVRISSVTRSDSFHTYHVPVRSGQEVFVRVFEPQRSYAFLWDDSGSMKDYVPRIHAALSSFCSELNPFTERVQLLPFTGSPESGFLLKNWGVNPHEMLGVIRRYGNRNSSEAHQNLIAALKLTGSLSGNRAIIIITDAEASENRRVIAEEWNLLRRQRLPILGFHVLGNAHHVDVMQDWAEVGGGSYYPVEGLGQLEIAFQRAKATLRRPAGFNLSITGIRIEEPAPGQLVVASPANRSRQIRSLGRNDAVEVILDASGSMLQRMANGQRRIEVARGVLKDFVSGNLPEGTQFALRVFGNREANSCRTDLEIALGKLNRKTALDSIAGINAVNLAKTPIAASLEAVEMDLQAVTGRKMVILLTDGEETCEGNPPQAIAKLKAKGLDIRVNIIGFAIRDVDLMRQFKQWASLGNGRYFDAKDARELSRSLEAALKPGYSVTEMTTKQEISRGQVDGNSVSLPAGSYTLSIEGSKESHEITIVPGKTTTFMTGH